MWIHITTRSKPCLRKLRWNALSQIDGIEHGGADKRKYVHRNGSLVKCYENIIFAPVAKIKSSPLYKLLASYSKTMVTITISHNIHLKVTPRKCSFFIQTNYSLSPSRRTRNTAICRLKCFRNAKWGMNKISLEKPLPMLKLDASFGIHKFTTRSVEIANLNDQKRLKGIKTERE